MTLPLRDVHPGVAPPWWPPAPGWWLVAAVVLLLSFALWWWLRRRDRRRAAILRLFDDAVAAADTPARQVAAISELLRRAGRRMDAQADRLQGDDWLRFLDRGSQASEFAEGAGRLLLDGPYRPDVDAGAAEALRVLARRRYLDWMGGR